MNLELDKDKVTQVYPQYIFTEFSEATGKSLEPIGLADNRHITIVKDEEDRIYCIDGCLLFYVSDILDEAKEILSKDKQSKFKVIVELD